MRGVVLEALEAQHRKRTALEEQLAKVSKATPLSSVPAAVRADGEGAGEDGESKEAKARAKAVRRAELVPQQLAVVSAAEMRLEGVLEVLASRGADLAVVRSDLADMGLAARLDSFDLDKVAYNQVGRPDGFAGLVVESPKGVPILIGQKSFSDPLLRRVARGTDLWFQVCEGKGSRVLLRTSMARHLAKSPRECMEMAADLAAYFSDSRRVHNVEAQEDVEVMFTDSRHVAKRGTRVGQMKDSKKLGTIWARPGRVAHMVKEAQEQQGWI